MTMTSRTESPAAEDTTATTKPGKYLYFCEICYGDAIDQLTLTGFVIPAGKKNPAQIVPAMINEDAPKAMAVRAAAQLVLAERAGSPETMRHPRHAGTISTAVRPS